MPSSAIASGAGDTTYVLRRTDAGDLERIAVTRVGSLAGETAFVPATAKAIKPGDQVKVG